jgi:hypothetical protein
MNDRGVEWVEKLPHRWARNAAIISAGISLGLDRRLHELGQSEIADLSTLLVSIFFFAIVAAVFLLAFGLVAYLIGMAARRRLRPLQGLPDQSAFKAVRWLPLWYGGWGLVMGGLVPLSDLLLKWRGDPFEPWDTAGHITQNVSYFLGAMIATALFTSIVGFVSRTAFRKRLGGSYGSI